VGIENLINNVRTTLDEWAASEGGGFIGAVVLQAEYVDAEGQNTVLVCVPEDQQVHRSMGLVRMADEMLAVEARSMIYGAAFGDDDEVFED
jgi:hypothetical protein